MNLPPADFPAQSLTSRKEATFPVVNNKNAILSKRVQPQQLALIQDWCMGSHGQAYGSIDYGVVLLN